VDDPILAIAFEYLAVKISQIKAQGHPGSRPTIQSRAPSSDSLAFTGLALNRRAIFLVMKSLAEFPRLVGWFRTGRAGFAQQGALSLRKADERQ
jgi:hypothetical protein